MVSEAPPDAPLDPNAARAYLLDEHADLLRTVLDSADRVAEEWDGDATTERPVDAFGIRLRESGILPLLPDVLAGAARAAGDELQASPVPAPPYVVVTAEGLLLRATLPAGRLVVTVAAFALERDPRRYVRVGDTPEAALSVAVR